MGSGVISEFVFSEVTTLLALRKSLEAAKEVVNVLFEAGEIEILKASEVFESSWEIFSNQENTGLSFVDASNLACMEMRKIRKIATFDKDFLGRSEVEVVGWVRFVRHCMKQRHELEMRSLFESYKVK